jgi:putative flippase GtrA
MQWNERSVVMPKLFIYSTVGVLNTFADFVVFLLLTGGLGYHPFPANMISYSVGVVLTSIINRTFTFRTSNYYFRIHYQFFRFFSSNIYGVGKLFLSIYDPAFRQDPIHSIRRDVGVLAVRAFVFASPTPLGACPINTEKRGRQSAVPGTHTRLHQRLAWRSEPRSSADAAP